MNPRLFALTLVLLGVGAVVSTQSPTPKKRVIEITRNDLLAEPGWNSSDVSILGVRLGMTRAQVTKVLPTGTRNSTGGFIVRCTSRPLRNICFVSFPVSMSAHADLEIWFDDADHVSAMVLDFSGQAPNHASQRGFRGYTRQLINRYSDVLRRKLLGTADSAGKEGPSQPVKDEASYRYERLGLIVHAMVLPQQGPYGPTPHEWVLAELIFLAPKYVPLWPRLSFLSR